MKLKKAIEFGFLLFCLIIFISCNNKHQVISDDKNEISIDVQGKNEPAIIFVHGWSGSKTSWRNQTEYFSAKLHNLFQSGKTPPPVFEKKCKSCSLFSECMPRETERGKPIERYILKNLGKG